MPTTTRSSEPRSFSPARRWPLAGLLFSLLGLFCGCVTATKPEGFFQLPAESAAHRAAQIRFFETSDEAELLSASAAVLQDLGFQIEECVREVGFLRAAKERSAREYGQSIARVVVLMITALGGAVVIPVDLHQKIAAAMVARPVNADASRHEVRIVFYRVVWKSEGSDGNGSIPPGEQKMEMIRDPVIYQQFFAKLSKAVFLEAHKI